MYTKKYTCSLTEELKTPDLCEIGHLALQVKIIY